MDGHLSKLTLVQGVMQSYQAHAKTSCQIFLNFKITSLTTWGCAILKDSSKIQDGSIS